MGIELLSWLLVRRNLFLQTLTHFPSNFSVLAVSNVTNSNAPSQNLFLHFIITRFNMSSADAAEIMERASSLGRLKTLDNVERHVSILSRFGCTDNQIANIIRSGPSLLCSSAERVLEPKIQLLKDFGMGGKNVSKVVTGLPWILTSKLEVLRSNLELLKTVFPTEDLLIRVIGARHRILGVSLQKTLKPSVAFWEDFGLHGTELTMFLLLDPFVLTRTSLTPEQLDLIRKFGIDKVSKMYKYVVKIVAMNRIEVVEARIHNLQLCGLSPEEILQVVRSSPSVLNMSEENIKKKMDFILNHMELSVDFVAKHPRLFTMSLDKVMRPRFSVLQSMTAMNGAGKVDPRRLFKLLLIPEGKVDPRRLFKLLLIPEAKFVAQIIEGHSESAALWTLYKNLKGPG